MPRQSAQAGKTLGDDSEPEMAATVPGAGMTGVFRRVVYQRNAGGCQGSQAGMNLIGDTHFWLVTAIPA
jgi:hypothetical protein